MNHSFGLSCGVLSRNHDDFKQHAGIHVAIAVSRTPRSPPMTKRSGADARKKAAFSSHLARRATLLEFRVIARICWLSVCVVALISGSATALAQSLKPPYDPSKDIILVWNQVMLDANAGDSRLLLQDQGGPTRTSRAFAIVSVAMFDALNSISHRYEPYLTELTGYNAADPTAAVSTAARDTLLALFPQQARSFRSAYAAAMANVPVGTARSRGIVLGRKVAEAILAERSNDNSDLNLPYNPNPLPGYHQPDPLHPNQGFYAPHWGFVTPFVMTNVHSHLSPPPPALDSFEYAVGYQQLLDFGGDGIQYPTLRSKQETVTGIFWAYDGTPGLGTPPRLYNQIVRTIAIQKRNTVESNARLFALVNLAMADAGIQCWYSKYYYELWRPIVGIREGDDDTNEFTTGDPNWVPLGAPATNGAGDGVNFTPPFPAYGSGHASFGTAAFSMTARFYGTGDIRFRFTSDEYNGINRGSDGKIRPVVTRTYNDLNEAILENATSRIYLGIHWPYDASAGIDSAIVLADEIYNSVLTRRAPR